MPSTAEHQQIEIRGTKYSGLVVRALADALSKQGHGDYNVCEKLYPDGRKDGLVDRIITVEDTGGKDDGSFMSVLSWDAALKFAGIHGNDEVQAIARQTVSDFFSQNSAKQDLEALNS